MLFIPTFLFLSCLSFSAAKEDSKNNSKPLPSKIQYAGEDGYGQDNNSIYGSSGGYSPYGGIPNIFGGSVLPQEILRNRFRGGDSSSQDENQDSGYQNEQSTGGSSYPYAGSGEGNEVPNGVFNNPFLGQRRRTTSIPSYGGTGGGGDEPSYGGGAYPGGTYRPSYRGGAYPGGTYGPSYGLQPGVYSSPSGFRPGAGQGFIYPTDQGYVYPLVGVGRGVGLRQPNYPYGYGIGNGYGVFPGILRNVPASFSPSTGGNGIYGQIPRGYGPALFGYGQYPEMEYPGLGFEYGRLNESSPRGSDGNISQQGTGIPYPRPTSSSVSPGEKSQSKTNSLRKEDP